MPKLIKLIGGKFVAADDRFTYVPDDESAPKGDVIISLTRFQSEGEALLADGRDIGDAAVLAAIAEACGLRSAASRAFLASDSETDTVHADNLRAHRLGINGVPCFLIDGEHAIAGAQESEVLERLIDLAACTPRLA